MRDLRYVEHDADIKASSACSIVWYSKESDSCTITEIYKEKYTIKLSANGDGQLMINAGYVNADGFQDSDGWSYAKMDSSYDRELSGQTYYAYYDIDEDTLYITEDLSSYSKGDKLTVTLYYYDYDESSMETMMNGEITVIKYDPSDSRHEETINYSAGDNQEIEVDQEILSVSAVLDEDEENKTLTMIEIPDSVTSIGSWAFDGCSNLTSVTIPDSVTSIGYGAFYKCSSLPSVTIGNGVTSIEEYAFYNCSNLTSVTIGNGVTSIGGYAFYECTSLSSITIPDSVTSIGESAFYGTPWYNSYSADTSHQYGNIIYINRVACQAVSTAITSCEFKDETTCILDAAFQNCSSLTSVTIPSGVTSIGNYAFRNCSSLSSVTIPSGVTSIGDSSFESCSSLTSVTICSKETSVCSDVFYGCTSLQQIVVPYDALSHYQSMPTLSDVKDKVIWDIINISGKSLSITAEDVNGYDTTTTITYTANVDADTLINGEHLENITVTGTCKSDSFPMNMSKTETVTRTITLTKFGLTASCTITQGVFDSPYLKGIVNLESSSSSVEICRKWYNRDYSQPQLQTVLIDGDVIDIDDLDFDTILTDLCSIYYTASTLSASKHVIEIVTKDINDIGSKVYTTIELEGATSISYRAYYKNDKLSSITIPNTVTSIGYGAFYECKSLTSVTIPDSVTSIGDDAFCNCTSLDSVTIGSGVTSIGIGAFSGCTELTSITIPDSVTSIEWGTFYNCSSLTSVTIPDSITSIGNGAFNWCSSLSSVTYKGTTYTSKSVLKTALTNGGVTVGDYAFDNTALSD